MIYLSEKITIAQAAKIARQFDCYLKNDLRGNIVITPRKSGHPREQYSTNVVPLHHANNQAPDIA